MKPTYVFVQAWLWLALGLSIQSLHAQAEMLKEQPLGLYMSSKSFDFSEQYYLYFAQFLKIDEDRSYTGDMKSEVLVRLGEFLSRQLDEVSGADTTYFVNADLDRGQRFMQVYQDDQNRLITGTDNLDDMSLILVVDSLSMQTRETRAIYIRSNQMIPRKEHVRMAYLHLSIFDPNEAGPLWDLEVCFDERNTPKVELLFDFYNEQSPTGKFLARLFSQWWFQLADGRRSNCE